MVASILVCHRSYLISAAVSHSQCITNSVCDLYQCSDVCMRQMFQEAEETEAMNEWIIGLTKRSYRYRILSPVICLLSLPYLARQKYTLSRTAGVCMNVEPLQIILLFNFFVLHLDRLLLFVGAVVILLLGCSSACNSGWDLLFCFVSLLLSVEVRGEWGTTFDTECTWVNANTTWSPIQTHTGTLTQGHTLHFATHRRKHTSTMSSLCPSWGVLTTIKCKDAKCFFPHVSCFANLQWVCGERKGHLHTHTYSCEPEIH